MSFALKRPEKERKRNITECDPLSSRQFFPGLGGAFVSVNNEKLGKLGAKDQRIQHGGGEALGFHLFEHILTPKL